MQGARTLDVVASVKSFASLLLPQHIEQALREAGFRRPSPVQEAALPLARLGTDLIVQAKAGTGKTLVFAVAAVERVDLSNAAPQVLVLAPTREIALQASEAVALVAAALPPPGLACGSFIGGLPVEEDEKQLRRACHVAVGTTGRVLSLIQRGALRCDAVRMLVLDEADKLLGDSFRKDLLAIAAAVPARRQTIALSATYAPAALDQLRRLMRGQQQEVRLCAEDTSLLGVRQCYRLIASSGGAPLQQAPRAQPGSACSSGEQLEARVAALLQLLSSVSFQQAVVFCKYTGDAEEVAERLLAAGYPAAYLSAQRSQLQRIEALNALRDFRLRVAVSTDLAARGVDLDRVNLVINLELPTDAATYMHRVGRAGRFGTRGVAVTLLEGPEQLARLEGYLREVAGGQVVELPDTVPEEWYWQPMPAAAPPAAAASSVSMAHTLGAEGPDTPAGGGGLLAASLAAGSLSSGGGPLADIATASLWLGEEDGGEEALLGAQAAGPAADAAERAPQAAAGEGQGDSAIEVSYQVIPKPASRGTQASAAAATPPSPPAAAAAKPAVSSLTAAVAAAEASHHRRLEEVVNGCSDSEDSWASTSDDEYSGSSEGEGKGAAAPRSHAPLLPGPPAHPLRRNSSSASMGSAGSSGSSSGSGRLSSPPAPIPGRSQQQGEEVARPPWTNSYEEGGRLAAVADTAEGGLAGGDGEAAPQRPCHCRGSSGSGDEEPSFRDSWLTEEQQQAAAAEKQRARTEAVAAAASASPVELKPHRRSAAHAAARPGGAARPAAAAARLARQAAQQRAAMQAQPGQQQSPHSMPPQQQQEQQRQGHYWDVVRSVEQDVRSRLAPSSAGGHPAPRAASATTSGTAAVQPAARPAPAAEDEGESSGEEFAPAVPRQRRPLGSAQLSAARRRQEEAAAARAAEAAALEMMAAAELAEEGGEAAHLGASAAAAAAAAGMGPASEAAAAGMGPASEAAAAAAAATAAEQQRQWSEFWMQHYAYYGCYPSEGLFSASPQAAVPATEAAPPAADAADAAPAASATLPPPPPSPPAPPPMLSAAAWACQPPEGAELQPADSAGTAGAAAAGSGAESGWVSVPGALLARYQQLEWQNWHRQYSEWKSMWEQYKQYWHALYSQQQQLEQQQQQQYQQHAP